jgi:hypothetical protein
MSAENIIREALLNDNSGGYLAGEEPVVVLDALVADLSIATCECINCGYRMVAEKFLAADQEQT